jgi:hypothetical protein|uniref:Uncharacterized protein n=1 Tax=Mus musculus TaxID=10090 RepID=Q6R5H4_MOUSE|nr:unknown [Mus musculus]
MLQIPDHRWSAVRMIAVLSLQSEIWKCPNTCSKSKDYCAGRAILGSESVVLSILSGHGTIEEHKVTTCP